MPTPTEQYIGVLEGLKQGDRALLRSHSGQALDRSVLAFDLFAALWWPLREKNQRAPRRSVAWLIAKLHASRPLPHERGHRLASVYARCARHDPERRSRHEAAFDALLTSELTQLEPHLDAALRLLQEVGAALDWVQLTDDLSRWEDPALRQSWADQFLEA